MSIASRRLRAGAAFAGLAALAPMAVGFAPSAGATAVPAGDGGYEVVARGLDNPRQITFGGRGALYVAEAGEGGDGPCIPGPEGEVCFGRTGAVTKVSPRGTQSRIMRNLPSLAAGEDGSSGIGPSDVSVRNRRATVSIGLGQDPAVREDLPGGAQLLGHLVRRKLSGDNLHVIADVAGYEAAANPDGDVVDSNPNSVKATRHGWVVADAGGNDLVRINRDREFKTKAVFDFLTVPDVEFPVAPVPTSVVRGPDRAFYVSQLTGFPFVKGAANIMRVGRHGRISTYASGLTNVTDLKFRGKALYAVEIAEEGLQAGPVGRLVRIAADGTQSTVADGLFAPFGLALRHGTAYVSTCAVCADTGRVIAIPLGG